MTEILKNIRTLYACPAAGAADDPGAIDRAAIAWDDGLIRWLGRQSDLPREYARLPAEAVYDAAEAIVVPGLIDCHTHLAFAGWRAEEFEARCRGDDYRAIARRGGGIAATVRATREATEDELLARARGFLQEMLALGVTTVEAKSGYGLTVADELKLLRVYRRLNDEGPQRIVPTLLAAHVVPAEYRAEPARYVRLVCEELIPRVARQRLAEFCDVFVEETAFSPDAARDILQSARAQGLRPKLHVDQLGDGGGARLAAEVAAVSADHLEFAGAEGLAAMARAGVVAVVLPLASLYLGQKPVDGRRLIASGVTVAVATDFNPGSAPSFHLPLAMTLACARSGLMPAEALRAATIGAARAIGRAEVVGSLEPGKQADLALLDAPSAVDWLYHFTPNACRGVFIRGRPRFGFPAPRRA
jgi:imidazolonepropionase